MARKRPGALTAAAIMCIVYGSLFSLCGVIGVIALAVQSSGGGIFGGPEQQQVQLFFEQQVPGYRVFNVVNAVGQLLEAIVILIAGVALLNLKSWGRVLGMIALIFAIGRHLVSNVYQFVLVMPAMSRFFEQNMGVQGAPEQKIVKAAVTIGLVLGGLMALVFILYLVITFVLLSKGTVRQALQEGGLADDDDQRRDYGERERRSQRAAEDYDEGWDVRRPADSPPDDRFK